MFEKILVPLDGSEHSMHALKKAVQIAKKFDGKITLIYVCSIVHPVSSSSITMVETSTSTLELVSRLAETARETGASILADGEKRVKTKGVQVVTVLREGHAVKEILNTAKEGKFDLIVMGARGLSMIKEIFLGSVSHGVTIHSHCPVLVVK